MPLARRLSLLCLALAHSAAFAQTTVTYTDGENANTPRVTTSAAPLTLSLASGNATEAGAITGDGAVTKTGAGVLTLSNTANSFTGGITVSAGTLRTATENLSQEGGPIHVAAGATFDFGRLGLRLDKVTGNGTVTGEDWDDMYFIGGATPVTSQIQFEGSAGLTMLSGDLTLARNSTWDGYLSADAGFIRLKNGTAISTSALYLNNDGTSFGSMSMESGASLNLTTAYSSYVSGELLVTGTGTHLTTLDGDLVIGDSGRGILTVSDSAQVTARDLRLGSSFVGEATVSISGAATRVSAGREISLGTTGPTDVTLSTGATLSTGTRAMLGDYGTLNLGAPAGSPAGPAGRLDIPQFYGTGTLQLNTISSTAAPLYLTRDNSATGAPIAFEGNERLVHTAGYTIATGNLTLGQAALNGGTLQLGTSSASALLLSGNITNNAELRIVGNSTLSATLNGTGQTLIPAGSTARLNSAQVNSALTLQGTLTAGVPDGPSESRVAALSGPGAIAVDHGSTLILTGHAAHTGGTTTINGTLQIGDGGTSGSIDTPIVNASNVAFARADDYTHTGAISGSGGLQQRGPGNLTLAGNYTHTGTTSVIGGNLTIGAGASWSGTSDLYLESGARFDGGNRPGGVTFSGLNGYGDLTLNGGGNLTVATTTNSTFGGTLAGAFHLRKEGAGTLTLFGAASHTGGTTVAAGTLQFDSSSVTGNIVNQGTVAFANWTTLSGTISGPGGVRVLGGQLTINAPQTYTGPTTLAGGQIVVGPNGSLASDFSLDPALGGFLDLSTTSANVVLTNPASNIGILLGTGSLTVTQTADTTARLSVNGPGTFRKDGPGKLILTGAMQAAATIISDGTLQLGNGGTLSPPSGNVVNHGALVFNSSSSVSFAGAISGSGSVTHLGPGTLTLSGNNTHSGGTFVQAGTLIALAPSALGTGSFTVAAGATLSTSSWGVIERLSPDSNPTLRPASLTYNSPATATLSFPTVGPGGIAVTGGGTLRTTANLAHTGVTTIALNSMLEIGTGGTSGTLAGNVTNSGTLAFRRADTLTYNGTVSGSGTLQQAGSGTLTLAGQHTYTGNTTVSSGTLRLAAGSSIASSARLSLATDTTLDTSALPGGLTLANGQRLTGTGRVVGALTAGSGSRIAPGHSPGTLTFTDGLTLADGSILDLELGTTSDLLRLTGGTLTGSASAGGIRLNVTNSGGFAAGSYTLIDFTGATTSGFDISDFTLGTMPGGYTYSLALVDSTLRLTATAIVAPSIVTQPSNVVVASGGAASFSVVATGNPAPTYQWRRNGVILSGPTSPTLSFSSVALANLGTYTVVVSNSAGSITSASASLLFAQTITFPTVPNLTFPASTTVTLGATASSGLAVTYTVISGPGTISGNQLTFTAAGDVVVRATQAGNTTYAPAAADQLISARVDAFANWQSSVFNATQLADPTISGLLADPDRDDLTNLAEYALGLHPLTGDANVRAPALTWDGSNWIFTWVRPTDRADVTYAAETSTDLATWSASGLTPAFVSRADGFDTWRVTLPAGTSRRQFFRLVFTR